MLQNGTVHLFMLAYRTCLVEYESTEPESTDNNAIDEPLLAREPPHGDTHGRGVGQRRSEAEHQAVGQGGQAQRLLDAEVGEKHAGAHESAA